MMPIYPFLRQYRFSLLFIASFVFISFFWRCQADTLPPSVINALGEAGISQKNVAVFVQRVDADNALVDHNAKAPMNPASTMKLVTTYAALELLGPAYTWKTELLSDAQPIDGVLVGNVYLRGGGAPDLTVEQFWLMLYQLHARGIRHIEGDLVLDRSLFSLSPHNPAAFDNKPLRPYNAGADALLINLNSLHFSLRVDPATKNISISAMNPSEDLQISNRVKSGKGGCVDWDEKIKVTVSDKTIDFEGVFPASCREKSLYLSPWSSDVQVARLFKSLWRQIGGTLKGDVRPGKTPDGAQSIMAYESRPLGEIVRSVNKYSNNVMARQLFLALDPVKPATEGGAARKIQSWLSGMKIGTSELVLENGSGLSRIERITAQGMGKMLLSAWNSAVMPEFLASLPVAGNDGTLKKRLNNTSLAGRAHLKTGYLEGVRAIAGYVLDTQNQRWAVDFLINDPKSLQGKGAIDELLKWVAEPQLRGN